MNEKTTPNILRFSARFVLDVHLARLARHLRMLGFDSLWRPDYEDPELKRLAHEEKRILLTRDRALHDQTDPALRHYVEATDPTAQLLEVLTRFDLLEQARTQKRFLTVCLECNSPILPVQPHHVHSRVPGDILASHDEFFLCPRCERVYWKGSHYDRMRDWISKTLSD